MFVTSRHELVHAAIIERFPRVGEVAAVRSLFVVLVLATGTSSSSLAKPVPAEPASESSAPSLLRLDGVYLEQAGPYHSSTYWRFCPDGTVPTTTQNPGSSERASERAKAARELEAACGFGLSFELSGTSLEVRSGFAVEMKGVVEEARVLLQPVQNGKVFGTTRVLVFVPESAGLFRPAAGASVAAADRSEERVALRFDGIYLQQGTEELTTCWRFYADGTAANARGPLDRPEICAGNMETSLRYGGPPRYRYTLDGQRLAILQDGSQGTAEGEVLWLARGHFAYECRFVADSALKAATETAAASAKPPAGAPESSPGASVALGRATMDERCHRIDFTPAPTPVRFPANTTEIAYRLTIGSAESRSIDDLRLEDDLKCETPGLSSRQCNKYGVVMGEAVLTSSTIIVRCNDGKPFRPGSYEMVVVSGGRRTQSLRLTIDASQP